MRQGRLFTSIGLFACLSALCTGVPARAEVPCAVALDGWKYNAVTGHWYKRTETATSWSDYANLAASWCGYPVTINDAGENAWIVASGLLDHTYEVWIGLNDHAVENTFVWANGEAAAFRNWDGNEPNSSRLDEDYATIYGPDAKKFPGKWNDFKEYGPWYGIVERDTEPVSGEGEGEGEGEGQGDETCAADPAGWIFSPGTGHWYKRTELALDSAEASATARAWCGYLVAIGSASENTWLAYDSGLLTNVFFAWIGLSDAAAEGTYTWSNDEPLTYTNWRSGQPDNYPPAENSVLIAGQDGGFFTLGTWLDYKANGPWYAIVERDTDPATGGDFRAYASGDYDHDFHYSLSEILRLIQLYNAHAIHCDTTSEDGYAPGPGDLTCTPHTLDYAPRDNRIGLSELLRAMQVYKLDGYAPCPATESEDGYCVRLP